MSAIHLGKRIKHGSDVHLNEVGWFRGKKKIDPIHSAESRRTVSTLVLQEGMKMKTRFIDMRPSGISATASSQRVFLFIINGAHVNRRLALPSSILHKIPQSYCLMFHWFIHLMAPRTTAGNTGLWPRWPPVTLGYLSFSSRQTELILTTLLIQYYYIRSIQDVIKLDIYLFTFFVLDCLIPSQPMLYPGYHLILHPWVDINSDIFNLILVLC